MTNDFLIQDEELAEWNATLSGRKYKTYWVCKKGDSFSYLVYKPSLIYRAVTWLLLGWKWRKCR